jgi:ribonuclease R
MARKKDKKHREQRSNTYSFSSLRGDITALFRANPDQIFNYKQVSAKLAVTDGEMRKQVLAYLNQLAELDILLQPDTGKFSIHPSQLALTSGVIDFIKSGAAYVRVDGMSADVYVPEGATGFALQGDMVQVTITGSRRGSIEGKVVNVISRGAEQYVGVIEITGRKAFVVPTSGKLHVDFFIDSTKINGARNGQKVIVKLLDWTDPSRAPFGEVVTVLGEPGNNEVEMHAILIEFGLPFEFPDAVIDEANKIDTSISQKEINKRRDFRAVTTFTIDPEDAKDFDDAISLKALDNGNYEVGVHIADVSHYLKPGSILDQEAVKRATSVYLVDRVVPMLPEVLSNFVCSLRPDEDKLCMSAVFELSPKGDIKNHWFGKTVIRSNRRFSYEDAQKVIESGIGDFSDEILRLHGWATDMRKKRMASGALEFGGVEIKFKLDDKGKPIGVYQKVMKEANWLIEEFMLLANREVATHIGAKRKDAKPKTFVYRIHDLPDPEKLKTLRDFVGRLGYKLKSVDPEKASFALNDLMKQLKDQPEEDIVKQMSIRAMSKAVYTTENIGHYGLAFDYYTHFTSPIRRYPDVLAHRLLELYSHGGPSAKADELEQLCKHSSNMEKRAADAERSSIKYKQVEYMLNKIGEVFQGNISGLTRWGIYVELEDNKCEGLIPLNTLRDDVYKYDEKKHQIIGLKYKQVFEFGDRVKVKVNGADLLQKQLDFRLV